MTALRELKHSASRMVGGTMMAIGLMLLTLLGLAAVVAPAALGILGMELARSARWLRHAPMLLLRKIQPQGN